MDDDIRRAYTELARRMKALAESEGDIYLPNPEPTARVDYILVGMEPSLGHWARSAEEAKAKVTSGFRNFLDGIEPMLLHLSVRRFLCDKDERYYITDFSKGAMLVEHAGPGRRDRYDRWYALLQEEINLIAAPGARIVAVGNVVADHLRRRTFPRAFTQVIHYSPLAGHARSAQLRGRDVEFRKFEETITSDDLVATARIVLDESRVPQEIAGEILARVIRSRLSESRRKLVFCYKLEFEAMKRGDGAGIGSTVA